MGKKALRVISLILVLALFIQLTPVFATETSLEKDDIFIDSSELVQEEAMYSADDVMGEMISLRSETEKHFRMTNGSFVAVGFEKPVHFLNDAGEYVDIDNTLVLKTATGSTVGVPPSVNNISAWSGLRYTNTLGSQEVSFAASTSAGTDLLSISMENYSITMNPTSQPNSSELELNETLGTAIMPFVPEFGIAVDRSQVLIPEIDMEEAHIENGTNEAEPPSDSHTERADDAESDANTNEGILLTNTPLDDEADLPLEEGNEEPPPEDGGNTPVSNIPDADIVDNELKAEIDEYVESRRVELDEESLSWAIQPKRLDSNVFYNNIYPNVDLEYVLNGNDIKENIIIKQPRTSYSFGFDLTLGNLSAQLTDEGAIELINSSGEVIYYMPPAYMFDAGNKTSEAISYRLTEKGSGVYCLDCCGSPVLYAVYCIYERRIYCNRVPTATGNM